MKDLEKTNARKYWHRLQQKKCTRYNGACSPDDIVKYLLTFARKEAPTDPNYVAETQQQILDFLASKATENAAQRADLKRLLDSLNWKKILAPEIGKASGMDATSSWLWKRLDEQPNLSVKHIVGLAMLSGQLHELWQRDIKVPIRKPGKSDEAKNLRPITLVSELGKIVEGTLSDACETTMQHDPQQGGWTAKTSQVQRAWMFWSMLVFRQYHLSLKTLVAFVDLAHFLTPSWWKMCWYACQTLT